MSNLETLLKVHHVDKKCRLGANADGGYVIAELDGDYDCYISAGISNEESFSRDFINKYNMDKNNSYGFDGTIYDYPYHYTDKITFIQKNINYINNDHFSNLSFLTDKYNNIFLKMDIEGGEYHWLYYLDENALSKFKQIVLEFHGITDDSWGCRRVDKITCIEKLEKTHYIVHAHANNEGKVDNKIPCVIELTYVNKKYFDKPPELNKHPLPCSIDYPNNPNRYEIDLNFPPFVNL